MSNRLQCYWQHPGFRLACWFGLWTAFGLLDGAQIHASMEIEGRPAPWSVSLRRGLESNLVWAVVGLGVLWFAHRYPFDRVRVLRWLLLHGIGLVLALCAYNLLYAAILSGQTSVRDGSVFQFGSVLRKLFLFYSVSHAAIFCLIVLGHFAWYFNRDFRQRERRQAELETELARARLDVLRMQLNPHFLFNSLNTIAALIHEKPEAADRMVTQLGELLRRTLDAREAHEIPLAQELAFLECYLEIELARFGDRLVIQIDAPAELRDVFVPALILQPLVENCVRHGVEQGEGPARIDVRVRQDDGCLELSVADNGPGLEEHHAQRGGIGLSNTRSRLEHLYGKHHTLELVPRDGGGLEVRLRFPLRRSPGPTRSASP